jgi:putative flippase GtrA
MNLNADNKSPECPRRLPKILDDFRRYATVGVGAALTDHAVYILLACGLDLRAVVANAVSRPLGGLVGFTGNRLWTFRGCGKAALPVQFARFWVVWGLSFTLTELLIWLFNEEFHWHKVVSKIGAEAVAVLFNFLMQKYWTFK